MATKKATKKRATRKKAGNSPAPARGGPKSKLVEGYDPDEYPETLWSPESYAGKILLMVSQNNYVSTACAAAGITRETYYQWMNRGQTVLAEQAGRLYDADGDLTAIKDPTARMYAAFVQMTVKAEAAGEAAAVLNWNREARADWRAAAELLRRRHPARWGDKADDGDPLEPSGTAIDVNGIFARQLDAAS